MARSREDNFDPNNNDFNFDAPGSFDRYAGDRSVHRRWNDPARGEDGRRSRERDDEDDRSDGGPTLIRRREWADPNDQMTPMDWLMIFLCPGAGLLEGIKHLAWGRKKAKTFLIASGAYMAALAFLALIYAIAKAFP